MVHYVTVKKSQRATTWINFPDIMLSKEAGTKKYMLYCSISVKFKNRQK